MHSFIGPWEEANLLYEEQSRLQERLCDPGQNKALVIYDVGMGIAANALAAIECRKNISGPVTRALEIISFENELAGIQLALSEPERAPFLQPWKLTVEWLLKKKYWIDEKLGIQWSLLDGDYQERLSQAPAPDLVYYDFYSPKSSPDLWSLALFQKLKDKGQHDFNLFTYSAATPVRVALLLTGFFVGHGRATQTKTATTVASTRFDQLTAPLDSAWVGKLQKSSQPFPIDFKNSGRGELEKRVLNSPHFLKMNQSQI